MNDGIRMKFFDNGYLEFIRTIATDKDKVNVYKAAIRRSLRIIQKQAKDNLKSITPNYNRGDNQWGLKLINGILIKMNKNTNNGDTVGRIEIMGNGKKNDFRLKFFENGTKKRTIKKNKANRGKMPITPFFTPAVESKQSEVENSLKLFIRENLIKKYEKFINNNLKEM